jgi:hypothetical protein
VSAFDPKRTYKLPDGGHREPHPKNELVGGYRRSQWPAAPTGASADARAWYTYLSNSIRVGCSLLPPILRGFFPIDNLMRRTLSRDAIPHLEQP